MKDLWRTIKFASRFKWLSASNFVLAMAMASAGLLPPLVYKLFFDLVENTLKNGMSGDTSVKFFKYSGIYLLIAAGTILLNRAANYRWIKWMNLTERELTKDTFDHIQHLSLEYFNTNQTGKLIERISKGVGDAINVMQAVLFQFFPQVVIFLITTIVLFRVNWIFGLIVGVGIPLYVGITLAFNKALIKIHDDIRADYEKLGSVRAETIMNIRTVKSYVQEAGQLRKLMVQMNNKVDHNMQWAKTANIMFALRGIVFYGSSFFAMALGIYLVLNENITLGSFVLVWSYLNKAYEPMQWIMRMYDDTLRQMRSVKKMFETLDTEPSVKDIPNALPLKLKHGELTLKNLWFNYPDDKKKIILKGIDLTIEPKTTVAIVGKSGSGKTTLAKLLMRFYDTTKGSITIDGQNISKVTQDSLRKKIGYVLQDSSLFNDTALNNIRFSKPTAKRNDVIRAARMANAEEFILKLPKGYDTLVGERGVKLSGGEQQRINIARAILKDSPIIIFDEATSSLDSESELLIQDALANLIKDRLTIIIAHRLSTVMRADLIVVMDKGKITEIGTHDDLLKKKGIYSKLFEIQSGGYLK